MDKKTGEPLQKHSPAQTKQSLPDTQPTSQPSDSKNITVGSEPLAPPPKPAHTNPTDTPDYFSSVHNGGTHFTNELNPFEQSFGAPSSETPGKGLALPPVAALTSPSIPGQSSTPGYTWHNSLRSGPLSPAMLQGPQNGDYFNSISQGFPTPNESSLRTGLTPGGGGSMFPAPPTPGTSALFQQLQSGAATPNTIDFQRTAINAAARNRLNNQTSNPQNMAPNNGVDVKNDPFAQHDATDAANGLFMLAKGGQANNQFAVPNQPQQTPVKAQDSKRNTRTSNGTLGNGSAAGSPDSEDTSRPNTRGGRGKKTAKADAASNGRRKAEATPKGANKRSKSNSGTANVDPALQGDDDDDDDDEMGSEDELLSPQDGKKMTDEEKRRNFLERNRVAALKCRQRKKQWLANLQAKVEMYSAENDALNSQVANLHDEIRNLRTLLMGHKDCPVGHAQGIGQYLNGIQDPSAFSNQHVNPYGMAMGNGMQQPTMQRS